MNTNQNNNGNKDTNAKAKDTTNADAKNLLDAALKAVRDEVFALQAKIDAETDTEKRAILVAEMVTLTEKVGFEFEGKNPAAKETVKVAAPEVAKEGYFARFKGWLSRQWNFVKRNKVSFGLGAAALAVGGAVYAAGPRVVATTSSLFKKIGEAGAEDASVQGTVLGSIGNFFALIGGVIKNVAVAGWGYAVMAKNWVVGLFTRSPAVETVVVAV